MENITEKAEFLRTGFTAPLRKLSADVKPNWGKMNLQQMVEHMSEYTRIHSGKIVLPIHTPEDLLPKYRAFLMTEKPFRENTPNPLMPDEPEAVKKASVSEALDELQAELDDMFKLFEKDPARKVIHPIFGELDYDMSVQMLHKHAVHHLKQFGIEN